MDIENNNSAPGAETPKANVTKLEVITTLFTSASKMVFMAVALAVIAALFTGHITGDQFILLAGMTFTFYFSNKGDTSKPFAGK